MTGVIAAAIGLTYLLVTRRLDRFVAVTHAIREGVAAAAGRALGWFG